MNRSEFIALTSSLIGGLALPGPIASAAGAELDESYLERGLTGMAKANGWFESHWGAGILAGYYLCKENQLPAETVAGIKKQLDTAIKIRGDQFVPLPEEPVKEESIQSIAKALEPAIEGGLRAHGHAVIFASLSIRALKDVPHMAQPTLVNKLCGLSRQISKKKPEMKPSAKPYEDSQEMIDATFDSVGRFEPVLGHADVLRPNFTHMMTHAEALLNLELMGFTDLAQSGFLGHRVHITEDVPEIPPESKADGKKGRASLEALMDQGFWNDTSNQNQWKRMWNMKNNPNGYWIAAGHLFKVLYSYHRLIKQVKNKEKVDLCSKILLERYLNPEVSGG